MIGITIIRSGKESTYFLAYQPTNLFFKKKKDLKEKTYVILFRYYTN
jgi:hypothetical protein